MTQNEELKYVTKQMRENLVTPQRVMLMLPEDNQ